MIQIPRLACSQDVDSAIVYAFRTLGYDRPTWEQERAIRGFLTGRDVLVIIPTGSGKSLCYVVRYLVPRVFDHIRPYVCKNEPHHSIFIVVSPLTALIQVSKYGSAGTMADHRHWQREPRVSHWYILYSASSHLTALI